MTDRRCPNCGEMVPSNSLTCPKCYHSIPREEKKEPNERVADSRAPTPKVINKTAVLLLALIPAAFGFMGFGQFYEGEYKKGALFLCVGLPLFVAMVLLIRSYGSFGAGWTFLALGMTVLCGLLFAATYIVQAADALIRSLFTF
jgi:hypothetical protein